MLWVWVPVLNLQEQVLFLDMSLRNGTPAAEDKSIFSLLLANPKTHPAPPRLQALQVQLTQVHTGQEQLLQRVNNLTRNPGTNTPSFCDAEDKSKASIHVG